MNQPFYASSQINRHGDFRSNKGFMTKIMSDKNTKFVPVLNGKNLFRQSDTSIEAYFFNSEQLKTIFPNGIDSPIFLGVTNNINYVGVDLDQNNSEMDLWCNKNSIIVEDLRKYGPTLNDVDASFLSLNNGMTFWHKTHQFCGSCGFKNNTTEAGFVKVCSNIDCGKSHFPRTDPAIITLISYKDKVLLGRSPRFHEGMYSTLAGFVEPGESLEQALER